MPETTATYQPKEKPHMDGIYQQNPDGSWTPAEPIGWQEEHGWLARFIFWLRRIEHCNDREGQRRGRR